MSMPAILQDPPDFSLVLGGPLFQMFRRAHLSGPALELLPRRVLVITLLAWLPLALLSAFEGHLLGAGRSLGFLYDIESHVRLLIALPVLISAELIVHRRIQPVLRCFLDRGLVTPRDTPQFYAAVEAAKRARDSLMIEVALLIFTFTVGSWLWRNQMSLGIATWYAIPAGTRVNLTQAGDWYCHISIPTFQFIILRWYLRILIWYLLLWRISRLNLRLLPTHPDRAGGIGFLGASSFAFASIVFAQGALLAGVMASRILYQGQSLMSFKVSIAAFLGFVVLAVLGPLLMFTPHLHRTRRNGLLDYGTLAMTYVASFDKKWVRGRGKSEDILGTADIQSLADLSDCYAVVRDMRLLPFALDDAVPLIVAAALPVLPLVLTVMPLDAILTRLLKIIL